MGSFWQNLRYLSKKAKYEVRRGTGENKNLMGDKNINVLRKLNIN